MHRSVSVTSLKRSLLVKLGVLLCILAAILVYSNDAVHGLIRSGRKEAEVINALGRQRMLVQQFVRQTNLALIGLSTSDWDTLLEQRKLSARTSEEFERSMHALLEGGEVELGAATLVLPRAEAPDVRAKLKEVQAAWEEVKSASVKVLRSNNVQLRDHPDLALMQSAASALVGKVDETIGLLQHHSRDRSEQLAHLQTGILVGGITTFVLLALFVQRSIINPLADTIRKLDASEEQHRNLYEAAPVALWQARLPDGKLVKVNGAMKRLVAAASEDDLVATHGIFSFIPQAQAKEFASTLLNARQLTEAEMEITGLDGRKLTILASARYFPDSGLAEGAFVDITSLKRAQAEVARINYEMLDLSRRAGMAEVATNVLHNVGNVLNSVNVSCAMLAEIVRGSKAASVKKTAMLLKQHENNLADFLANNPQGKMLPAFLEHLAERLADEQSKLLQEINELDENIDHINSIVFVQQRHANVSGIAETVQVRDLVEDAFRMSAPAMDRHQITVTREYQEGLPGLTVEKHKVLQILVNLIRNAKHALVESDRKDKQIILRITRDERTVSISVIDNGIGIAEENSTRIFAHGFTTKKDGHGFGLHSGALAARDLGGQLRAHSDGPGKGATFTLALPIPAGREAAGATPLVESA